MLCELLLFLAKKMGRSEEAHEIRNTVGARNATSSEFCKNCLPVRGVTVERRVIAIPYRARDFACCAIAAKRQRDDTVLRSAVEMLDRLYEVSVT